MTNILEMRNYQNKQTLPRILNNIQILWGKDDQLMDLIMIKYFSCRPILYYALYVTFIHDKLHLNADYRT